MKILKKVLHLNYNEPKGEKRVVKSYNFEVAPTAEDTTLKKLIAKNIEDIVTSTKESL